MSSYETFLAECQKKFYAFQVYCPFDIYVFASSDSLVIATAN
jgi:hypothetical protein